MKGPAEDQEGAMDVQDTTGEPSGIPVEKLDVDMLPDPITFDCMFFLKGYELIRSLGSSRDAPSGLGYVPTPSSARALSIRQEVHRAYAYPGANAAIGIEEP